MHSEPREFFNVFKPFLGSKGKKENNNMIRLEIIGKIKEDQRTVAEEFATYFANTADLEGSTVQVKEDELARHESILQIKGHVKDREPFVYQSLTETEVFYTLKKIDAKKSVGWDRMPPDILKLSAKTITPSLRNLYNFCRRMGEWPSNWKRG